MKYAILACTGLDKAEGSVAREVAILLAEETGCYIICPVVLNRTPARYKKTLAENQLIIVDGCATRCASKLAPSAERKPAHRVLVSEVAKKSGRALEPGLSLGADGIGLAQEIVRDIRAAGTAQEPTTDGGSQGGSQETADVQFERPSDFIVVVHDKYEFRIPSSRYFFNANDVWVVVAGKRARVGISDYMQQRLTDITYVEPPDIGTTIEQFGEAGIAESTKATFEIVSPVSGTVIGINEAVTVAPESINEDPYGAWIVELELSSWQEDRELLIDGTAYAAEVERKADEDSA